MAMLKIKKKYKSNLKTIIFLDLMQTHSQPIHYISYTFAHINHFLCCKDSTVNHTNISLISFGAKHDQHRGDEKRLSDTLASTSKTTSNMNGPCHTIIYCLCSYSQSHSRKTYCLGRLTLGMKKCFGCDEEKTTLFVDRTVFRFSLFKSPANTISVFFGIEENIFMLVHEPLLLKNVIHMEEAKIVLSETL